LNIRAQPVISIIQGVLLDGVTSCVIQPTKAKIQSNQDRVFGNYRHSKHILL